MTILPPITSKVNIFSTRTPFSGILSPKLSKSLSLFLFMHSHITIVCCILFIWLLCVSVPCRPGTPTYKPQVKTSCRACSHTLSRALRLWTLPPSCGGLRRCHMSYGSGPRLPAKVGSGAATCPMAPDLASRLRWAPA
jgi:hypothetical protein